MSRKKKKSKKNRGRSSHGYGSRKHNRGAGHKGGRGKAGTGKRRGTKEPTYMNQYGEKPIGKRGMVSRRRSKEKNTINLYQLDNRLEKLMDKDYAKKKKSKIEVNLAKAGYDKLLGAGNIRDNVKVKVSSWSEKAEDKLKEAEGGVEEA